MSRRFPPLPATAPLRLTAAQRAARPRRPIATRHARGGLMLTAPDGAYSRIVAVTTEQWLATVAAVLQRADVDAQRKSMRLSSVPVVLAAAEQWARSANRDTGRDVAVSHATVAAKIGLEAATVKRVCRFLSRLGLMVEIRRGRNILSRAELADARAAGAHKQRAVASTRALTIPPEFRTSAPLPDSSRVNSSSPVKSYSPTRAKARKSGAVRPPLKTKKDTPSFPLLQFTAWLVDGDPRQAPEQRRRLPWHLKTRTGTPAHIGNLARVLHTAGIDPTRWTPKDLIETLERHRNTHNTGWADIWHTAKNPLGYLRTLIRTAIDHTQPTPQEQRATAAAQRHAEHTARQAARAAEHTRLTNTDHAEIQRIIAQMHADYPRTPRNTDRRPWIPTR